jgi:hypothetical protein
MSELVDGLLIGQRIIPHLFPSLNKSRLDKLNAIVIHQTGASTAKHTFNSRAFKVEHLTY